MQGKLETITEAKAFILAGNATFTALSTATGKHFTFRIRKDKENEKLFWVGLLTGSDNENSFRQMGRIVDGAFKHNKSSSIGTDAPGYKAFNWLFWKLFEKNEMPAGAEIFHEGKCGACGRKLTVPSSVKTGLGPDCAEKLGVFVCEAA